MKSIHKLSFFASILIVFSGCQAIGTEQKTGQKISSEQAAFDQANQRDWTTSFEDNGRED
jgi:uncharacterized protein YceK